MTRGPAATRPYATVTFRISPLIQVEAAVYNAVVSDHGIKRSTFTLDDHPAGSTPYDKVTGEIVSRDALVKKVETEEGWVFVDDHEVEALFDIEPNTLVLKAVQPQHLYYAGAYLPKAPLSVEIAKRKVGSKKVPNHVGEQLLAALLQALDEEGQIAVCELTTRGVPKPCVLLPDGTLWTVYHDDEVRAPRPRPDVTVPAEAVRQLREQFLNPLFSTTPLDLTDHRTALIQEFADSKARKGDFGSAEAPDIAALLDTTSTTDDLMALLTSSIAAAAS